MHAGHSNVHEKVYIAYLKYYILTAAVHWGCISLPVVHELLILSNLAGIFSQSQAILVHGEGYIYYSKITVLRESEKGRCTQMQYPHAIAFSCITLISNTPAMNVEPEYFRCSFYVLLFSLRKEIHG